MIMAPNRLLRLWKARLGIRGRVRALTADLKTAFPQLVRLTPSAHSGGFDSIYFLESAEGPFGVLRLNNPHQKRKAVHSELPRRSPSPAERIVREWSAYSTLAPLGLSPTPLWRADDAIVCSYSPAPGVRKIMENRLADPAAVFTVVLNSIGRMHEAGIVHLDLSPGNVLVCPKTLAVALIDFEYAPVAGRSFADDCAFDWRHMTNRIRRRAGIMRREGELEAALQAAIERCDYRENLLAATCEARAA
jgi:hypothetical protein